jgi:hypothetical protein
MIFLGLAARKDWDRKELSRVRNQACTRRWNFVVRVWRTKLLGRRKMTVLITSLKSRLSRYTLNELVQDSFNYQNYVKLVMYLCVPKIYDISFQVSNSRLSNIITWLGDH